jgi:hypothetical protein
MVPARTSALLVTAIFSLRLKKTSTYTAVRICEASSLCEELRRPPGGRAQQALYFLGSEDQQDRVDECGLSHTGAAGDDRYPTGQGSLQCLSLAWGESLSSLLLAPGDVSFAKERKTASVIDPGTPRSAKIWSSEDATFSPPRAMSANSVRYRQERPVDESEVRAMLEIWSKLLRR